MNRIRVLFLLIVAFCSAARADSVYVTTTNSNLLSVNTATGAVATFGPSIPGAEGLATDGAGNLYVGSSNAEGTQIYELSPSGTIVANGYGGTSAAITGLAVDQVGNVFAGDFTFGGVIKFTPSGSITAFGDTPFYDPHGVAFDSHGNLYVASSYNNSIGVYAPNGVGSTFATTGINDPRGLAFDKQGNLFVANAGSNTIEEFTPGGVGTVFASTGLDVPIGIAFDSLGNLIVANSGNNTIEKFAPNGDGTLLATVSTSYGELGYLAIGSASVPEPSSLILLAVGALGILTIVLRRRTLKTPQSYA
jgi:PEP-CTERM motif/NHL repeat